MVRSTRAALIALVVMFALAASAAPAAAVGRPRLDATLELRFDDGGFGSITRRLIIEGSASDPSVAAVLAARVGTATFRNATLNLIDRIEGQSDELADQLERIVNKPASMSVKGGHATIVFSGTGDAGEQPSEGLWTEVRRGSWITFVVQRDEGLASDVRWIVAADLPDLEVASLRPGPERNEVIRVKGTKRRELRWVFGPGGTRPEVMLQVKIDSTLQRTLATRGEVFDQLHAFAAVVTPSVFFVPLFLWTRRRRPPRKDAEARAVARALRILSRLWLLLVTVALVQWLGTWLQHHFDYPDSVAYLITGTPLLAAATVALTATRIAKKGPRLRTVVPLFAIAATAFGWSAHELFSLSHYDNEWFQRGIASVAGVAATCGLALALVGVGALLAEGVRAAGCPGVPRIKGARLALCGLAALLLAGPLVQVAAFAHASYEHRRLVSSMFSEPSGRGDWLRDLSYTFIYYPFNFHRIVLGVLPLVGLAFLFAAFAHVGRYARSSLFTSGDGRYRGLLVLAFAAFVVGPSGGLYGFAFPLAFALALVLAHVVLRPTLERAQGRIEKLNGRRPRARPIVFRERHELLGRSVELDHLQSKQKTLYGDFADETISRTEYEQAYRRSRRRAKRLTTGRHLYRVQLPPGVSPRHLALALGPRASWWENGLLAMRWGLLLAAFPLTFYAYVLVSRRLATDFSSGSFFGVIDVFQSTAYEVAFWLVAAFALGALYPYLLGRNGAIKGAALASLYGAARGLAVLILPGGGSAWFFRFLQLFLFLAVLGIVLDWRTLVLHRASWRQLIDHYQVRDLRVVAGYLAPAIGALIVIADQLHSGQASDATSQLIKSIPGFVPPAGGQ